MYIWRMWLLAMVVQSCDGGEDRGVACVLPAQGALVRCRDGGEECLEGAKRAKHDDVLVAPGSDVVRPPSLYLLCSTLRDELAKPLPPPLVELVIEYALEPSLFIPLRSSAASFLHTHAVYAGRERLERDKAFFGLFYADVAASGDVQLSCWRVDRQKSGGIPRGDSPKLSDVVYRNILPYLGSVEFLGAA